MQIIGVIVSVIMMLILLAVSFYIFTLYCHPEDKGIGVALPSKILIIVCQTISWGQLLLLPLDASSFDSSNDSAFAIIYSVVYLIILILAVFVVPFTIFLYEADEEDPMLKRICWSLLFAFIIAAVFLAIIFISYIWLGVYTVNGQQVRISGPLYALIAMALGGWVILVLNGGIGLVYLPYELILSFINRPQQISSSQAYDNKKLLQDRSSELIERGQKIKQESQQYTKTSKQLGWFERRKKESSLISSIEYYKEQVNDLEQKYQLFDEQIKVTKSHPLLYYVMLVLGILSTIGSILWFIQLIGTTISTNYKALPPTPLFRFIDGLLSNLQSSNMSFIGTFIYSGMVLYLQICTVKGNLVFGIRIPYIISFHPMKPNKTYLNSFLFNVNLMMLSSVASSEMSLVTFQYYLANTYLESIFVTGVTRLPMYGYLYEKRVLQAFLLGMIVISLITVIIRIVADCRKASKKKQQQKKQAREMKKLNDKSSR